MKKALLILISILMAFSLWGCTPKETVTVDLSTMTFTAYVTGNAVIESKIMDLNAADDKEVRSKLKVETWVPSERKDKSVPKSPFILIDDQNHQYHFSQNGTKILIAVTQSGKNPLFYESNGLIESLWSNYFAGLANELAIREQLLNEMIRYGSRAIDGDPKLRRPYVFSSEDGNAIKTLVDLKSWHMIYRYGAYNEFDFTLTLSGDGDKLQFTKSGVHGYAVYTDVLTQEHIENYTYVFDIALYDALESKLETLQASAALGLSDLLKSAVFDKSFLWVSEVDTDSYSEWVFPLSAGENQNVRTSLQIDNWIRIETEYELSSPEILLYMHDGKLLRIGYAGDHVIAQIEEQSRTILEQYLIPSGVIDSSKALLFSYWETGPTGMLLAYEPHILTRWVSGSFIEYKTKDFVLSAAESKVLMDLLKIETWTIDPNQSRSGDDTMCHIFCLSSENGQIVIAETYDPKRPYDFATIDLGGPTQFVYYIAPDSVLNNLVAYLNAHYPVK